MGYDDRPALDAPPFAATLPGKLWMWLTGPMTPYLGWVALLCAATLAMLPAFALDAAEWIRLEETLTNLLLTGALAVLITWWLLGWSRPVRPARSRFTRIAAAVIVGLAGAAAGLLVVSQFTAGWLPGPGALRESLQERSVAPALAQMDAAVARTAARYAVWWVGVQSGGAAQDEVVFGGFAGLAIWGAGALGALLARRTRSGFAGAIPALVIVGGVSFFAGEGRLLFLGALGLALALHVALDNAALEERWERERLDSSSDLLAERWLNAAAVGGLALLVAGVAPNLSVDSLARLYARVVSPLDERIESVREDAFPAIEPAPRYDLAGTGVGLPNAFLLGAGPSLAETQILLLRTSDAVIAYDSPSSAPYLRAAAFSDYDGRGWSPPDATERVRIPANSRRDATLSAEGEEATRRLLAQTIRLYVPSRTMFAAGEPVEISVDSWVDLDEAGEIVTVGGPGGSYAAVSAVPALSEEALRALPAWGAANPLPPGFERFLALPPTVTARTVALAQETTAGLGSPFDQALALEALLRTFPYDLGIDAPPEGVDVADWFLFDLQRGYCDYYATAFVVMARALGLPARFATGYATGDWLPDARSWRISAADAHAWPEVYIAGAGWIPFEPTASRAPLPRIGASVPLPDGAAAPAPPAPELPTGIDWNPQMLVWLMPLGAIVWGLWRLAQRIRAARADPWLEIIAWGARAGRPPAEGETALEYTGALAGLAAQAGAQAPERRRSAARRVEQEAAALGAAVSAARFAPPAARPAALRAVEESWRRLRPALAALRR